MTLNVNAFFNLTTRGVCLVLALAAQAYGQQIPQRFPHAPNTPQPASMELGQLPRLQPVRAGQQTAVGGHVRPASYSEPSITVPNPINQIESTGNQPNQLVRAATADRAKDNARTRIVRTVSSLGVVGGLMMGFIWWTRKNQGEGPYIPASDLVEVVGRVSLDAKHKAHIVRFGDRLLLLSLDGNEVSKLGEIGTSQVGTSEVEQRSSIESAAFQRRVSSI